MSKPKGLPKTGGRKPGTPNKKNAAVIEAVQRSGITPLEYMLDVMRKPIPDDMSSESRAAMVSMRFEAAKAAAPYVHPRLSAIDHAVSANSLDDLGHEELRCLYSALMAISEPVVKH